MDARTRFETRTVGALPVLSAFLEDLGVANTIDQAVPWEGGVPLGTLAEIMMLNRLLAPKAQFRIGEWAQQAAVTDYYGLTEEQLNDDLLGRALERLNEHQVTVQAAVVANAVKKFKLDVRRIHYDISNVELFGDYQRQLEKAVPDEAADSPAVRVKYRLIYVWSEAKAAEEAKTRERHVAKIREEFEAVERNLNKYSLVTEKKIVQRLESAKSRYAEGEVFDYRLTKNRQGKFTLTWKIDQSALRARQDVEGGYVLKTNQTKKDHSAAAVLQEYKEQTHVERRIGNLKGPLAAAPMNLEKPERMGGMLLILMFALMVLALLERTVRRSLKGKPMYGLYPENRPSAAPTAKLILDSFSLLCIVIIKDRGTTSRRLAELSEVQRTLVRYLGIPPNRLTAFKRKCCNVAA